MRCLASDSFYRCSVAFLSQRDTSRPRISLLISPLFQVTTESCGLDVRSIVFNLLDQPRPTVLGSYPSIDHGIIGRLRPLSLVLNTFKIMYLDGWVSQPKSHSFRQSDNFNKSSRFIHDRLLAPVPYCVNRTSKRPLPRVRACDTVAIFSVARRSYVTYLPT